MKPKILLVDDLKENLTALEALLRADDVEIHQSLSARGALDLLLDHEFALAMIDVQMPEMDGFELAELMRGTERSRHIPIIFVTAGARDQRRLFQGYEAGAVDFLFKPLDPHVVKSKVHVFLELFRQRQQLRDKVEELGRTKEELETALRSRDEFLSIASHELKTPITSLKLQLQMAHRGVKPELNLVPSPEKLDKAFRVSSLQVKRLTSLVDDLLDVARIQSGRLSFDFEPLDLGELIAEVAERFSEQLKTAKCRLTLKAERGVKGEWDRSRIEQVILNLLGNVVKYAPGSLVELVVQREHDRVIIEVRDNGPGISKDKHQAIFERFERASSPRNVTGLGLGLFIVKEIVAGHGGTIRLESEPGKGSDFIIELPLHSGERGALAPVI